MTHNITAFDSVQGNDDGDLVNRSNINTHKKAHTKTNNNSNNTYVSKI
jgi:hypothetical protein